MGSQGRKRLWTNVGKDPTICGHAVNFLRTADPGRAVQIFLGLESSPQKNARIGNVYGLAALGVSALTPRNGSAVAVDDSAERLTLSQSVRAALLKSDEATVVLSAMATVESARRSLRNAELWTPERQAFARVCWNIRSTFNAARALRAMRRGRMQARTS